MRVVLGILIMIFSQVTELQACDICGCGVGGYYSGMLPEYHKHFIGLRWRFSGFRSDLGHEGESIGAYSKEYFHTLELMGRFYPHRRVQILAFVPLSYHLQVTPTMNKSLVGLGDASILALYNIYNTSFWKEQKTKHNWLLGGGIKVPTGTFQHKNEDGKLITPSLQLGTGSVDFLISNIYTIRHKRWGVNTNITYKINLPNEDAYKFGNQLSASAIAFFLHKMKKKNWGFMPKVGVVFEHANYNLKHGYKRINTGGNQLIAMIGLEIYHKKIQLGLNYQQPTWQQLSDGLVEAGPRFMANINYLF